MNILSKSAIAPESDNKNASAVMEDWYKRVRINIDTHNCAERLYGVHSRGAENRELVSADCGEWR
jgi:hypothetical protein